MVISMINYKLKADALNNPDFLLYRKAKQTVYKYVYNVDNISVEQYDIALQTLYDLRIKNPKHYKEFSRLMNSRCHRVARLRERIRGMILNSEGEICLFLTLTFRTDILEKTTKETRRRYVQRFLNSLQCNYTANIDFGAKNHREHYHCVIQKSYIDYSLWNKPYGRIDGISIGYGDLDTERVAKYIAKLTNHAIKETTKNSYILYNRKHY